MVRDTQEMEWLPREAPATLLSGSWGRQPWGAIRGHGSLWYSVGGCGGSLALPLPLGGYQDWG